MYFNNNNISKIDEQMRQLQNLKNQYMQQPMIQQNFMQSNFNDFDSKWVDNIDEVKNAVVNRDTIFMNRNESIFYMKSTNNIVKSFEFEEVVEIDEKEQLKNEITLLKEEIEKMKGIINNESVNEQFSNVGTVPTIQEDVEKPKSKSIIKSNDK